MLLEAIRNGAQGMDDLTNYVDGITNFRTLYHLDNSGAVITVTPLQPIQCTYPPNFPYAITNGYRIVGLLSTPKFTYDEAQDPAPKNPRPDYYSNYVVAIVRSMSGGAFDKYPQDNSTLREASFKYKLISEVTPYYYTDGSWMDPSSGTFQGGTYTNVVRNKQVNLYDVRLIFRWPVLPNGNIGNNRLVFRTQVSGSVTNEATPFPKLAGAPRWAYFFENRNYVKAK